MKKYAITDFGKSVIFSLCLFLLLAAIFVISIYPVHRGEVELPKITENVANAEDFRMVIFFGEWSSIISVEEFRHIELAAELATANPTMILNVDGYSYDPPLGEARARAITEYLVHIGVPEHQIIASTKVGGDHAFLYFTKK